MISAPHWSWLLVSTVLAIGTASPVRAQDPKVVATVQDMRAKGTSVNDIVARIGSEFRLDERAAATVLAAARVVGEEAAPAILRAYRTTVTTVATGMRAAGYSIDATATGLSRTTGVQRLEVVDALRMADFPPQDVQRVSINILKVSAAEMAGQMKEKGATALEVAAVLKDAYRLAPAAGGDILILEANFPSNQVTAAFRLVWMLDVNEAIQALADMNVSFSQPWSILEAGGYEIVAPTIERYRIADYRPGRSGQWLENVGVVDPDRVVGIAADPSDGLVNVLLRYRDLDGIEADFAGTPGEIVGRVPHTFQADGATWDGEWLQIRFRDFDSGWFRLARLTRTATASALALAYHVLEPAMIEDPIRALSVVVGQPAGTGTLTLPGGVYGGVTMEGSAQTFDVPEHQEAGITAEVHDLASSNVTVATTSAGSGMVQLDIDIEFETSGAEIEGTFLDYIPCWKCSTFEIPKSACAGLSGPCIMSALGNLASSLGTCLDPANWEETEIASGPAVPFQADLTSPSLGIRIVLNADPATGAFAVKQVLPDFQAGVTLRTNHDDLELHVIQDYIMNRVSSRLMTALTELDLAGRLVQSLETARSVFGWGTLRGLDVLPDGRWFLDARY